jgi:hypothetical protein
MVLGSKAVDVISALRGELPQSSQALKKETQMWREGERSVRSQTDQDM